VHEISFEWDVLKAAWEEKYSLLVKYLKMHRTANLSRRAMFYGVDLFSWCWLDAIGFAWNKRERERERLAEKI